MHVQAPASSARKRNPAKVPQAEFAWFTADGMHRKGDSLREQGGLRFGMMPGMCIVDSVAGVLCRSY